MSNICESNKKWFPYRRPINNPKARLFVFHHAGGTASIYKTWFGNISDSIEILPLQLPGHETRINEKLIESMPDLCEAVLDIISPMVDLPYAFFGHSMGALAAFETTRLLRNNNMTLPSNLFLSAHRAPDQQLKEPPMYDLEEAELIKKLKKLGGTSEELLQDPYFAELFIPVIRADMSICETYSYSEQAPLPVPIHIFGGSDDPNVSPEELNHWSRQTNKSFTYNIYKGDHFYLSEYLNEIFSIIKSNLLCNIKTMNKI